MGRYKLTIDLDAVAHNWHQLNDLCHPACCSAVVKADAYGLGAIQVTERLYKEGCRDFFVATLAEALELRAGLSFLPKIYVLSGIFPGEEHVCIENNIIPTLVSLEMFNRWLSAVGDSGAVSALKVDTGMGRLGLSEGDLIELLERKGSLARANVQMVMSHLACADIPEHPLNLEQLKRFDQIRDRISLEQPELTYSLANSAGCLLGSDFHIDLVRPGVSLYGVQASSLGGLNLRPAVNLSLSIIQLRALSKGQSAGYGAEFVAQRDSCVAVVAGGYADGVFRCFGGRSSAYIDGVEAPIIGRVSMDSILLDLTGFGLESLAMEEWPQVELLGRHQSVEDLSADSGVLCYEILTSLGQRFERSYVEGSKL